MSNVNEIPTNIQDCFSRFIYETQGRNRPLGRGEFRARNFLDLMSACHSRNWCELLASDFAEKIKTRALDQGADAIIVPKRGNVLLARQVAENLGLPSGCVWDNVLFGRWVEGNVDKGKSVLLVNDIATDGEMLSEAIETLSPRGYNVRSVVVFVRRIQREQGDDFLSDEYHLPFNFIYRLNDDDLSEILALRRNPSDLLPPKSLS